MRLRVGRAVVAVAVVLAVLPFVAAAPAVGACTPSWRQYQGGPGHAGHQGCESKLTRGVASSMVQLWSDASLGGRGPAITAGGGLVVLASRPGSPVSLVSVDPRTGVRRWTTVLPMRSAGDLASISGMVVVSGDGLVAVDARTGTVVWVRHQGPPGQDWSPLEGLAVVPGHVIVYAGRRQVLAFDPVDGSLQWSAGLDRSLPRRDAPAIDQGLVYVPDAARVHALDLATGLRRWTHYVGGPTGPLSASGGSVYVTAQTSRGAWMDVVKLDGRTGHQRWRVFGGDAFIVAPVVTGSQVFSLDVVGYGQALDIDTGALQWRFHEDFPEGTGYIPPIEANGLLFVSYQGQLDVLNTTDGTTLRQWGGSDATYPPNGILGLADGVLTLHTSTLIAYGLRGR